MDVQLVSSAIIRDTLLGITDVTDAFIAFGKTPSLQIFFERVPDYATMPYIVISYISGGYPNRTQVEDVDINMKVLAVTSKVETHRQLLNAISQLQRRSPDVSRFAVGNPDGYPVVSAISTIRHRTPIDESYIIQNVPYFMAGGIFRLRYQIER